MIASVALCALLVPAILAGQGTLVTDSVSSPALASNVVGEKRTRQVLVYLPPSYRRNPARRYPVLYLLHGATSLPIEWVDGSYQGLDLRVAMDSLIAAAAIPEFIVVMPDANNVIQASFYANSPATGNWKDFVVRDLVRYIDGHYRTETNASRRALVGHSMGGFGAFTIGFDHPALFGLVYAVSPCCIGFVGRLAESSPAWRTLSTIKRWQDAPGQVGIFLGIASALDGSATDPRLFAELPFSARSDGSIVPNAAVQSRWLRANAARARIGDGTPRRSAAGDSHRGRIGGTGYSGGNPAATVASRQPRYSLRRHNLHGRSHRPRARALHAAHAANSWSVVRKSALVGRPMRPSNPAGACMPLLCRFVADCIKYSIHFALRRCPTSFAPDRRKKQQPDMEDPMEFTALLRLHSPPKDECGAGRRAVAVAAWRQRARNTRGLSPRRHDQPAVRESHHGSRPNEMLDRTNEPSGLPSHGAGRRSIRARRCRAVDQAAGLRSRGGGEEPVDCGGSAVHGDHAALPVDFCRGQWGRVRG